MDAYDRIQEETVSPERESASAATSGQTEQPATQNNDLGTEFKEAYQALSTSSWGLKLGGFFEQVKKQGASYYEGAKQELSAASAEASKGWTDLISHTSTVEADASTADNTTRDGSSVNNTSDPSAADAAAAPTTTTTQPATEVPESLPADIVKEAETMLSKFRVDAAARLKQIQQAEDAADAALERFGANIKNFLRDAVTIAPPSIEDDTNVKRDVLFESKDIDGKRVVHATRFDAQLHVIHSNLSSFTQDPASPEYSSWKESFDVEKKTDIIAKDLDKYDELRRAMDTLVPEQVSYPDFWTRYYFLRHVIETEEQKRRELLKGTQLEEEEIAWDDDEDDDEEPNRASTTPRISQGQEGHASTTTLTANNNNTDSASNDLLKPSEPRRSNEQSVADSDASYDIVSGATSRSPGTPGEEKDLSDKKIAAARRPSDDSDDDWE